MYSSRLTSSRETTLGWKVVMFSRFMNFDIGVVCRKRAHPLRHNRQNCENVMRSHTI